MMTLEYAAELVVVIATAIIVAEFVLRAFNRKRV
jgi:hypothetical protein